MSSSESEQCAGNGNFPSLREVPRHCTHIFAESVVLPHIMQVANGLHDVRQDDKRAGQASLCAVQANTKAIGTTQAQKERTTQWNNSTNQTWSSAWSNLESK